MIELPLAHGWALVWNGVWMGAALAGAETLRRAGLCSPEAARKVVHVTAGLWVLPAVFLFADWRVAVVAPLAFAALTLIAHRFRLLPALDDDPANLGAVFFPLAFAVLLALFFRPGAAEDTAFVAVAGILTMALGDAAAAVFGRRFGTRRYTILGHSRTMEGSLAMFLVSAATIAAVLVAMAGFAWHPAVAFGLVTGTVAAGIEAACPYGSDNLFVPVGAALVLWALVRVSSAALGVAL